MTQAEGGHVGWLRRAGRHRVESSVVPDYAMSVIVGRARRTYGMV